MNKQLLPIAGNSAAANDDLTINNNAVVSLNSAVAGQILRFEAGDDMIFDTGSVTTAGNVHEDPHRLSERPAVGEPDSGLTNRNDRQPVSVSAIIIIQDGFAFRPDGLQIHSIERKHGKHRDSFLYSTPHSRKPASKGSIRFGNRDYNKDHLLVGEPAG